MHTGVSVCAGEGETGGKNNHVNVRVRIIELENTGSIERKAK